MIDAIPNDNFLLRIKLKILQWTTSYFVDSYVYITRVVGKFSITPKKCYCNGHVNIVTALIGICAMQGHLPVVEYLCNASADVNKADINGWTPLYIAAGKVSL